jgi:NtrC-family two-component system sensor histidine kinase KinB
MARIRPNHNASKERKASEWLSTLYVINDMLKQVEADGLHIEVILPRVLDLAVRQLEAHDGSIIVVNHNLEIEHAWLTDQESDPLLEEIMHKGVAGWVIRHKSPVLIDDTRQDERWFPDPSHATAAESWSVLCTPFVVRDRAIGAITIHKPGENMFQEQDLDLLFTISSQAASTIENARLYEDMQRQLQMSALLNEASRVINSSLDINEIMQSLLTQMNEFLNAEAISIALVDKQTNELVYQVAEGIGSAQIVNLRLPSNLGLSGWVMEHAEPVLVADTSQDHRFHRLGDRRTGYDTRAMICAPIQFQEEVLGTIQAINPVRGSFTSEDLNLLVNLANIASSAIANAQQFALIQAAESRYLSLFHGSVDPIILTDMAGKIVEANQRSLELLKYDRRELLQKYIQDLHPPSSNLPQAGSIEGDEPKVFTSQLMTTDNQAIHVQVHAKRTLFGDQELLQWIHHDISRQIELEEMRQDLMAMLFHDLQSPLSNVIASLDLLIDEVPQDIDPAFPAMLDIAMRSSRRLQSLIRSLLDINILEAGLPLGERSQLSIVKLFDDVEEIQRPNMEKRNVELVRQLDGELPDVYVEEDMIRRVLVNLIDNALRYSEANYNVSVGAFVEPDDSNLMRVTVRDHGIGIPEKYHQIIFNKWERGQTNPASRGLGLGLAFCRLAVEAHGGRIWVENAPGGGASFSFTLPCVTVL